MRAMSPQFFDQPVGHGGTEARHAPDAPRDSDHGDDCLGALLSRKKMKPAYRTANVMMGIAIAE